MKLLGGNAHLTAKTKLSAVGETGSDIHIYRSTIHTLCKIVRILFRFCNDSLAVATGMKGNMLRCRFHIIYHFYREDIIQKFRIEVLRTCRCSFNYRCGSFAKAKLYRNLAFCGTVIHQPFFQKRQKCFCNLFTDQAYFLCITYTWTACFGIFNDGEGFFKICTVIHIDMADSGSCLDARHFRLLHAGTDESCTASWNQ